MKKIILLLLFFLLQFNALSKQIYGFKNISLNYLNWSEKTEENTNYSKADFYYIELEGGAGFDWGDVYGFYDLENPFKSSSDFPNNRRSAMKFVIEPNIGKTDLNLYMHVYDFSEDGFSEQNRVIGLSYKFNTKFNFWIKPFIGLHDVSSTYFSGVNGMMTGWVFGYDFNISKAKFSLTNWNEIELYRNKDYISGKKEGINGALALWWHATDLITAGIQYRYTDNKLGSTTYQDGSIVSLKFNF
jgi:hypothetical protein